MEYTENVINVFANIQNLTLWEMSMFGREKSIENKMSSLSDEWVMELLVLSLEKAPCIIELEENKVSDEEMKERILENISKNLTNRKLVSKWISNLFL